MRVRRAIHQRFACAHSVSFSHIDMRSARKRIFAFIAALVFHENFPHAARNFAEMHHAVNFADRCRFFRLAGFKQLHNARQTAGNVFRLGRITRNFRNNIARENNIAIIHLQMRSSREHLLINRFIPFFIFQQDARLVLLISAVNNHFGR